MIRTAAPFALLALLAAPAIAQDGSALRGHNTNAPIDISSDRIEVQDRADRAIWVGNVHVIQGDMTMDAARMTVAYRKATTPGANPEIGRRGLSVVSIAKSYDKRVVLSDVSVSVGRGEVIGLLGPNGAGKTTCFYSVMGLVKPDSGRIMLDGDDITGCRCIAARSSGSAICRRKPRSSAG
jgi:ABC-type multidrug transport system fused ATPase/permease subunit